MGQRKAAIETHRVPRGEIVMASPNPALQKRYLAGDPVRTFLAAVVAAEQVIRLARDSGCRVSIEWRARVATVTLETAFSSESVEDDSGLPAD